jgi:hypothetical protein
MGGRDQSERLVAINRNRWSQSAGAPTRIVDGDFAFFTTWCPAATSIETLVAVEGHRWAIEDSFETAKNEFGLDHNESRSWHGWHRHVSMVMLAFAMMAVIRHRANPVLPKKRNAEPRQKQKHRHTSVGRSRKSAASPQDSLESASSPRTSSHGRSGAELTKPPLSARTSKQNGNCNARGFPRAR